MRRLTEQHAIEARWRAEDLVEAFLEDQRITERLIAAARESSPEQFQ
jgi:hypothetical protein